MESTAVTPELIIRAALECAFLLALFAGLLFFTDLRKRLYGLGAAALVVLYVAVGAWFTVQMVDRWQYDYPQKTSFIPLTRFAMYQAQLKDSVEETYSWQATLADGTMREINIAKEFEAIGLPPLSTRMRVLLNWMEEPADSEHHAQAEEELALYATALLRALEQDGVDVGEIGFYRVTGTPGDVSSEPLVTWDVSELEG
ncbi:hypothetical protein ABZ477_12615 [Microbacterium sp. NPDC019599]|uniref:hypothetical protein n=1 Tax=Microbacterium sp. NPDC019599 TaxID=3154690 RepID=UPI0033F53D6E